MTAEEHFKTSLSNARERVTAPRLLVFRALSRSGAVSMPKLIAAAKADNIDKVTVYRTVDLLRKLGLIQEVGLGRNRLLELVDEYHSHHHHFTCIKCGKIIDFDSSELEADLAKIGEEQGFSVRSHQLELTGTCKACLAQA